MLQVTINLKFALNSNFSFTFLFFNYLLGRNHYLYLNFSHLSKMLLGWLGLGIGVYLAWAAGSLTLGKVFKRSYT